MGLQPHYLSAILVWLVSAAAAYGLYRRLRQRATVHHSRTPRFALSAFLALNTLALAFSPIRIADLFPPAVPSWTRAISLLFSAYAIYVFCVDLLLPGRTRFQPGRRRLLFAARTTALAAPVVAAPFLIAGRNRLRLAELEIVIPGLPPDLDGLRIVQLSDIHMGPFLSEKEVARAVDMANETKAHLGLVTGDMISSRKDPLDACLRQLSRLRTDAGVAGCHGNHEVYARAEEYATQAGLRAGIHFLRHQARIFRFGSAELNVAGVDYQQRNRPYLVGVERLRKPSAVNLLLSHNPDVFPVAARQGFDLTIAGHTHGGQVNVEILHENVNPARFFTPFIYGRYQRNASQLYVTRGIGTVGVPARLNAPPEISLIRLRSGMLTS